MVRKHEMSPSLQGMTSWTDGVHSALFAVTCCNHPAQTGETPAGRSAGQGVTSVCRCHVHRPVASKTSL